jgi:hypothetical protein
MCRKIQSLEPGVRDKDFGLKARHQAAWTYAIPQPRRGRDVAVLPTPFARILRSRCGRKVAGRSTAGGWLCAGPDGHIASCEEADVFDGCWHRAT